MHVNANFKRLISEASSYIAIMTLKNVLNKVSHETICSYVYLAT